MKILSVKSCLNSIFFASKNCRISYPKRIVLRGFLPQSISPLSTTASEHAKPFEDIPGRSALGNILNVLTSGGIKNLTAIQERKFAKYGPIFKDKVMGKNVVNICDADSIEEVYRAESNFALRPSYDVITESWREFGGILGNDYEAWKKVRHYSNKKMLRPVEVEKHNDDLSGICADLVRRFRQIRQVSGQVNDLELEAMGWSGESMGMFVYGQRLGFYQEPQNPRVHKFMNATSTFSESLVKVAIGPPIWKYVHTPTYRKLLRSISALEGIGNQFIDEIIQKQRNQSEHDPQSHALFDHFISTGGLTSKEMNAIALGLTQAAFEGTSYTAQWLMYHFACQPEIQEKAYQEILCTHGTAIGSISYKSLKNMTYIKACIKEAQRMSPTALFLSRVTEKDLILCGYFIPAGTELFLFPSLLSRSPKFYDNPSSFDPDRWMGKKLRNPYAYLPFGHGVRMCLGRRVAELMLLMLTVHLIRAFRMTYVGRLQPLLEFRHGVQKPNIPLEIVFKDRTNI